MIAGYGSQEGHRDAVPVKYTGLQTIQEYLTL